MYLASKANLPSTQKQRREMSELYKAGIIEVTEAEEKDEDEDLFEVAAHFEGEVFLPSVVFEGKNNALRQAKKLYDWLDSNPKQIKGERLCWQSYTIDRKRLREYPACYLPYYYFRYDQCLEVSVVNEQNTEAIAYGWLDAEPLPYYVDKKDSLVVIADISDDAVLAGWHKAIDRKRICC